MPSSDMASFLLGARKRPSSHIAEALRLSPRDPGAFTRMSYAGMSKNTPGSYLTDLLQTLADLPEGALDQHPRPV